jgi:hypothetical protein
MHPSTALGAGPTLLLVAGLTLAAVSPAVAQNDIVGEWQATNQVSEDQPHRAPGATLGDYTGMPINDAARQKARTWDASILSQPERMAQPHPAQYSLRGGGGPNLRIVKVVDPVSGRLIAYQVNGLFGRADRIFWMDGRPHPPEHAEHTWGGFSTAEWVGNSLEVTTTHMKMGVLQRNGVPSSPKGRMVEFWTNHGGHMGVFTWVDDPVYLEEPFIRTTDWFRSRDYLVGPSVPFETVDELGDKPRGWVPSWPLGTEHRDLSETYKIPYEATQGGKQTLYPEYMKRIEELRRQ